MKKEKIKVVKAEDKEVIPTEVIAQSIKEISEGVKKIRAGKLNEKALIILVHKASGVATDTVRRVINGMESLEREFLKPRTEEKEK